MKTHCLQDFILNTINPSILTGTTHVFFSLTKTNNFKFIQKFNFIVLSKEV